MDPIHPLMIWLGMDWLMLGSLRFFGYRNFCGFQKIFLNGAGTTAGTNPGDVKVECGKSLIIPSIVQIGCSGIT